MTNDNDAYTFGVRLAEALRKARLERQESALGDMIDLVKTRDVNAKAIAREKALKRLERYPSPEPSPHVKFTPVPKGSEPHRRNSHMFEGIGGSWAGSRRIRREFERFLVKHGFETFAEFASDVEKGAFGR